MIKTYHIFNTVVLDSKSDINGDESQIICDFGCNGDKHAIEIIELIYVDGEIVHGNYISSQEIGKCTCYNKTNFYPPKGGFILDNQINREGSTVVTDLSTLEMFYIHQIAKHYKPIEKERKRTG